MYSGESFLCEHGNPPSSCLRCEQDKKAEQHRLVELDRRRVWLDRSVEGMIASGQDDRDFLPAPHLEGAKKEEKKVMDRLSHRIESYIQA